MTRRRIRRIFTALTVLCAAAAGAVPAHAWWYHP